MARAAGTDPVDLSRPPLTGSQRRVLAVVFIGIITTTFPITVLTVSLPRIADDVDMSPAGITWVVTGPLLANAIATPILGKIGDLYGHRRVFVGGFAAATVFALATSVAWNGPTLIAFRTLSQLCGAATSPSGMAIIMTVVARQHRLRAVSWWAAVSALGPTLGLVIGGPLVDAISWRAVFILQSVPAVVCLAFAIRWVPATARRRDVSFDVPGALTFGLALLTLMLGINRGAVLGWRSPLVVACLLATPVLVATFVAIERRARHPLLPLGVLTARNVSSPLASQPFVMGPFQGAAVVAPFLMASEFGMGTTAITAVALSRVVAYGAFGGVAGRTGDRMGERGAATFGTGLVVLAMGILAGSAVTGSLTLLVVGMLLTGGGAGFSRTPFTAALANAVDESELGIASATMNLAGQVGSSLGVTAMTAAMAASDGTHGYVVAFLAGGAVAVIAVLFAVRLESSPRSSATAASPDGLVLPSSTQ